RRACDGGGSGRPVTTPPPHPPCPPSPRPGGTQSAYGTGEDVKHPAYSQNKLAVIAASGGQPRMLAEALDRPVRSPEWSKDGAALTFVVADDRSQYPGRIAAAGGRVERLVSGKSVIGNLSASPGDDAFAVLASTDTEPPEVAALEDGRLRRLSHQNDELMSKLLLGTTEEFTSISRD